MKTLNEVPAQAALPNLQRIQALAEQGQVKICLERFDDHLGWYIAGSLVFPAEQVAVLQQALQRIGSSQTEGDAPPANVIRLASFLTAFPA